MDSQTNSSSKPELLNMKQVRLSYTAVAINLEVSPKYIVVSLDDKTVRVFDSGGELLHLLKHEAIVWSLAIHDNMLLCGEIGGGIQSWDLLGGSMKESFTGHTSTVRCLAFSGSGSFVSASRDTTLKIWSLKAGRSSDSCDATLGAHMAPVVSLAFDPASHFVTSGSQDGICRVWNLAGQATSVSTLSGHVGDVRSLALFTTVSANESRQVIRVVSGGADGTVKVWNAADGSLIADLDGHTGLVGHVLAVTSDSRAARTLVTAGVDGMIKAWEMSGTPRLQWVQNMAHENGVTSLHSNGKHVISGGADSKVRVWELQTGRMVKELGENFDAIYKVSCKQGRDNGNIVVARQHGSAMLYVD